MKRLLVALVAAVAVSTVFAKNTKQGFEENKTGFVAVGEGDESDRAEYGAATKPSPVSGLFETAGDYFLDLDTGDATLWATNSGDAAYFDMNMQFNPCATAPEVESGTKIAVYLNTASNLVVISGPDVTTNVTSAMLNPGAWARLTVAGGDNFKVYLDGVLLGTYPSLTGDASVKTVGFKGSGALDNFVARTTDPFLQNPAATIDGEGYASYSEALAEALAESTASATATITIPGETPKTMNGSASNPYEIASAGDLLALQNAVLANAAVRSLNYVQTANIDMAGVAGFYGIGWFKSSDSYASLPSGLASASTDVPFSGVYDGAGYKISNVRLVRHNYAGVFNCVEGTVKNLTVENLGFVDTSAGEWGCGIVGNAQGNAILEFLTSATSAQNGFWGDNAPHNTAGIAARAEDCATIRYCVNNAAITASAKRLGGIISFTGTAGSASDVVSIIGCTNNAAINSSNGSRGVGGIIASPESATAGSMTLIKDCANFGTLTAGSSGFTGAIVGSMGVNANSTWQDDGGNTYLASVNLVGTRGSNTKAIVGLAYALPTTIDDVAYLTTVAAGDLAAGNTYMLLADVAASETPVFTLEAVGDTIAFNTNGYNFAGTVAGTSTIVVTDSTVDAVKTFTAAAGVASVDDVAYATFADALAAIEDDDDETTDDFVTLIADNVAATIDSATTIKVKTNDHPFTPTIVGDFALSTTTDENGITTYTTAIGVAKIGTTAYASFADAYAVAKQTSGTVIVLLAEVDETITAVDGETMNFSIDKGEFTSSSIELNVPANVTVNIASSSAVGGVTVLSGEGRIVATTQALTLTSLVQQSTWCGTLEVKNASWANTIVRLDQFGNMNSTVCANYIFFAPANDGNSVKALEIGANGLTLEGVYASGTFAFPCALTGSGRITVKVTDSASGTALKKIDFTGDVSGFNGSIDMDSTANACVNFGTGDGGATAAKQIGVKAGGTVTVAASKTWTASDFMFNGNVTLDGTLVDLDDNSTGKVWNNKDTAVLRVNRADACVLGNVNNWRGTYIVGWSPTGVFNPNNYGNANSTVALAADLADSAYFGSGSKTTLDILPAVRLDADIEIKNGYSETNDVALVTFAKLTGDHNFTTSAGTGSVDGVPKTRRYAITTLDNFTGSFKVKAGSELRIATVNVATGTDLNGRIIAAECDAKATVSGAEADGVITGALALTVAGEATGKVLEYKADGADGAGLYVKASAPVTPIDPAADTPSAVVPAESAKAAIEAVEVTAPAEAGSTEEEIAAYKDLFTYTAVETSAGSGVYTVTMTGVKEEVKEDVSEDAVTSLVTAAEDSSATTVTVDVPAGLYYKVTTYDTIGGTPVDFKTGISSGSTTPVTKPTSATQGFIKVEMGTKAFNNQQ